MFWTPHKMRAVRKTLKRRGEKGQSFGFFFFFFFCFFSPFFPWSWGGQGTTAAIMNTKKITRSKGNKTSFLCVVFGKGHFSTQVKEAAGEWEMEINVIRRGHETRCLLVKAEQRWWRNGSQHRCAKWKLHQWAATSFLSSSSLKHFWANSPVQESSFSGESQAPLKQRPKGLGL